MRPAAFVLLALAGCSGPGFKTLAVDSPGSARTFQAPTGPAVSVEAGQAQADAGGDSPRFTPEASGRPANDSKVPDARPTLTQDALLPPDAGDAPFADSEPVEDACTPPSHGGDVCTTACPVPRGYVYAESYPACGGSSCGWTGTTANTGVPDVSWIFGPSCDGGVPIATIVVPAGVCAKITTSSPDRTVAGVRCFVAGSNSATMEMQMTTLPAASPGWVRLQSALIDTNACPLAC